MGPTSAVGALELLRVWAVAGTIGPIALIVALTGGSTTSLWIGISGCVLWAGSLLFDWLLVRRFERRGDGWTPWRPPESRWLRG